MSAASGILTAWPSTSGRHPSTPTLPCNGTRGGRAMRALVTDKTVRQTLGFPPERYFRFWRLGKR
jgi:hypothetical protein